MKVPTWAAKALFWPTFVWNWTLGRVLRVRNWWDLVEDVVLLGARPLRSDVPALATKWNVTGVVNMCEEYCGPVDLYQRWNIEQLWLPTTDFNHPSLASVQEGVEFIQRHVEKGGRVYVHCKAGRARSATVVLCWLIKYRGMSPDAAQRLLLENRPHVNSSLPKRPVVQEFCAELTAQSV
ncbi:MAG: phosphatidylglycerophosphatase and protein-tyrosine phosphatase 1 family protein [Pirellula sp.]|jgi:atypical dual specificity phosphatase|nr:phosphatidylglycerophosphatase and protein-tyrosine phosphatase 1 family protein [Pirellula sp.]